MNEHHARALRERGFTVMPGLYAHATVARLRSALDAAHEAAGRPPLVSDGHLVDKDADTAATAAGYAVRQLLDARPELAPILLEPRAVATLRAALGDDMVLELAGGLISDASRPFFKWHNHVGGIDDRRWERRLSEYPRSGRPERVLMLIYLQPIEPDTGSLLVYPRAPGDPIEAPYPLSAQHWDGEVVVTAPAGTAVLLEQSTWHAALPQRVDAVRMFVGCYFASATAPPGPGVDEALRALETDDPLLASVLPARSR